MKRDEREDRPLNTSDGREVRELKTKTIKRSERRNENGKGKKIKVDESIESPRLK